MTQSSSAEPGIRPIILISAPAIVMVSILTGTGYLWYLHNMLVQADQALLVDLARMLLDGKQLYTQIHEINPPLIMYLNTIPVIVSRLLNIPMAQGLALTIYSVLALCLSACSWVFFQRRNDDQSFYFIPLLLAYCWFCASQELDFAQKEHFLSIVWLPFFVVRYFRWKGEDVDSRLAIASGVLFALGVCLKHYFLVIAAAPELVFLMKTRRPKCLVSPETVASIVVGFVYAAHFLFLPAEVRNAFFGYIVPAVKSGYQYYVVSLMMQISSAWRPEFVALAVSMMVAVPTARVCSMIAPVVAFTLASTWVYLVAGQDWSYHMTSMRFGIVLLLALESGVVLYALLRLFPGWAGLLKHLYLLVAVVTSVHWASGRITELYAEAQPMQRIPLASLGYSGSYIKNDIDPVAFHITRYTRPGDKVVFMGPGVAPGHPALLQLRRELASRYPHSMTLFMLRHALDADPENKEYQKMYRRVIREYGEDITINKPDLIVIHTPPLKGILEESSFIKKYMKEYRLMEEIFDYAFYLRVRR